MIRSPLRHLDLAAIDSAAQRESRNRELHLPPVSVYRWWARRTESVNGAIVDAFLVDRPGRNLIADPFSGGGVIPLAALIRGQRVYAQDLNPWAADGLAVMLGLPDPVELETAWRAVEDETKVFFRSAYETKFRDGAPGVIAHTFRVATAKCSACGERNRLFPHAMVSLIQRKERGATAAFLACPSGHLFLGDSISSCKCPECKRRVDPNADYTSRRIAKCSACSAEAKLENWAAAGTWAWEVVLVERANGDRRQIDTPTAAEVRQANSRRWSASMDLGLIPDGQETRVLLRHGFRSWVDIYPRRQRAAIETLLTAVESATSDRQVRQSLRLIVIGAAEMAGHLSRWDRWYLKSYEAMANHRFNFTTFSVEPNVWGSALAGRGTVTRRLKQFLRAARWLKERTGENPYVEGPLHARVRRALSDKVDVRVVCGSSERMMLDDQVVDLVLTDPPYHDDVQYGELSLPFRAWSAMSTEALVGEAVVNDATGHNAECGEYRDLLQRIFSEATRTLRSDGHLVFSYANRDPEAWIDLFSALQAAGLRSAGCAVVHSENETDHAKRGVRACTLDLILDLVPVSRKRVEQWASNGPPKSPEEEFLRIVQRAFLKVGRLERSWADTFRKEAESTGFLAKPIRRADA
jgi:putative DNA methylase